MKYVFYLVCLFLAASIFAETKVLAFAASTRKDSYNKALLEDAVVLARKMGAKVTVIDLKDYPMPFYDADLEADLGMPEKAKAFRNLLLSHDMVIIASPEYNGSIPALLKNTIDWASRSPTGTSSYDAFEGKRFAIMSASPSRGGGARALVHLKTILENVGGLVVSTQVPIPSAYNYFSENKRPENKQLKEEIIQLLR